MPAEIFINGTKPMKPFDDLIVPKDWGHPDEYTVNSNATDGGRPARAEAQATQIYRVALPIIFGIIISIGIIGNVMVMVVIATRKKMRSTTNFLLFNLAIADVIFLVICGPFTMAHYALDSWLLGNAMCQVIQYFLYVTCYVTVYTLVAVAVVRYCLMVRLSTHPCVKSPRYAVYVIIAIWSASVLINVPVPLSHGATMRQSDNSTECVISCRDTGKLFFPIFFVFSYGLPLLVVTALYTRLVLHLRKNQRHSMVNKAQDNGSKKSSHVTRLLILVVTVFAVCWFPLHVHLLWWTFGQLPDTLVYRSILILWHALVFMNSALNPVIYHFFSSEFRENFKKICRSRLYREGSSSSGSGSKGQLMKNSSL